MKSKLLDGLDVDFTGTRWEAEWLDSGKICKCKACDVARKCLADIEMIKYYGLKHCDGFWSPVDILIARSEIVFDRPGGSKHPRFDFIYPLEKDMIMRFHNDSKCMKAIMIRRESEVNE